MKKLFKEFLESEKAGGIILICCTFFSLMLSNSTFGSTYISFWTYEVFNHSISHWINDGLMTIFFLLIGLELEREVYAGELSTLKKAALPLFGALGGMLVPALIFFIFNVNQASVSGVGIPMATDIAFALGILSLLGSKVPLPLKIFLTALAVIDDLGAILIIALFYSNDLALIPLVIVGICMAILFIFNRMEIHHPIPYIIGGIIMWYFMLQSGIHATISGVLLAFVIPFGTGTDNTLSSRLQHWLHFPVAYAILPLFALSNTAILIPSGILSSLAGNLSLGIILGLLVGKPLGIFLATYIGVKLKWTKLPKVFNFKVVFGVAILGGIGFTMSMFTSFLAFKSVAFIDISKLSILIASSLAAVIGYFYLSKVLVKKSKTALQ